MTADAIKKLLSAQPFRPFRVRLASGKEVPIPHPELVNFSPGGRTMVVWRPDESDESFDMLDVLLIESAEPIDETQNGSAA
ncbi:MAG: hypothetical protein AAFR38_12235 [Planctomycetota bacterium]